MARTRRLNPAVWTALGFTVGAILSYDWTGTSNPPFDFNVLILATLAGLFVSIIVAAWPKVRELPSAPCPRCGHPMQWDTVVCQRPPPPHRVIWRIFLVHYGRTERPRKETPGSLQARNLTARVLRRWVCVRGFIA